MGFGLQGFQTAASTFFSAAGAPLGIAAIIFAQNFGPALFVPLSQAIFTWRFERLLDAIPAVGGSAVSSSGVLGLKEYVESEELGEALWGMIKR